MMVIVYIAGGLLIVLLLLYLILPVLGVGMINRKLHRQPGIRGHVKSLGLNLISGRYTLLSLELAKRDEASGIETLTLTIRKIVINIPLSKLLKKDFSGSIFITEPDVCLVSVLEKPKQPRIKKTTPLSPVKTSPLRNALQKLPRLNVNVTIDNGRVRYIDHTGKPKINARVSDLNVTLENFSNAVEKKALPATLKIIARVYEGIFNLTMKVQPMQEQLTFTASTRLTGASMVQLNDFFRAFANIDVNAGTFEFDAEMEAQGGAFNGYLTPVLKDIDIIGKEDSGDSMFKKMWEGVVATVFQMLENNRTDQVATRIPFEGRLDDPHVGVVAAITGVLKNAFVQAIKPTFMTVLTPQNILRNAVSGTGSLIRRIFN